MQPLSKEQIAGLVAAINGHPGGPGLLRRLAEPFPAEVVSWRVGPTTKDKKKGMALCYIDARDVMDRLDYVMGADWQCDYTAMPDGSYCCRIGLLIDGEWRWRSDGAVTITDSEEADAKEMAQKGSYSDAFKRAAVRWGVGRYLYDVPSPWVELDERRKIVETALPKLRSLLNRHAAAAREKTSPPAEQPRAPEHGGAPGAHAGPTPTPEPWPSADAAVARPSAAAATARAPARPAAGGHVVGPAGEPLAETLLAGIPHTDKQVGRLGLRHITAMFKCATKALAGAPLEFELKGVTYSITPEQAMPDALNAVYGEWWAWFKAMTLPEAERAKVLKALESWKKVAKAFDAAIADRARTAGAQGADPDSGELQYEPPVETA
jgi:hypothetical protein